MNSKQISDSEATRMEAVHDELERRVLGKVDQSFFIIGVGASAGGLDAIKQLVAQVGEGFQHSFVVIQHISPNYKSLMSEILGRETNLVTVEVVDDMPVEPGHVYLIPPKTNVVIQGTVDDVQPRSGTITEVNDTGLRFSLVPQTPRPQLNLPIDVFFHSLAEAVGDRSIAIVLSGTGTDGSRGLRAVKDVDGFVMVQDPGTADFDGMPMAAIATNLVDMVTSPDAMVSELERYISLRQSGVFNIDHLFKESDAQLDTLLRQISQFAHIDFTEYKKPTLKRRIARRIALNRCKTFAEYVVFIESNPTELEILHREFLVGVTNFFRDLPSWKIVESKIVPKLFDEGDQDSPVKIWSVGCSTGEEAYTIALIMEKYRSEHGITRDFRVFACDVNEDAIRSARDGIYSESVIEEIPEEYRTKDYIAYYGGTFHIKTAIRNRVIFNAHNVLQEPPYINTDLVICRNLLIYLGTEMQKRALSLFAFSLRDQGFLFLGAAENISHQASKFENVFSAARIYKNKRPAQRSQTRNLLDPIHSGSSVPLPRLRRLATREPQRDKHTLGPLLDATLANVDGCVLILDEGGTILETMGDYRRFIELPDRAFSANVFDLLHDRLKGAITLLLRRAEADGSASSRGTKCSFQDRIEVIDLHCRRIEWETQPVAYSIMMRKSDEMRVPVSVQSEEDTEFAADNSTIMRLETEIETLREMLAVTTEDLGISNEELQTANEELTVSNEELQANNEEMQSINEELHTVNAENADKITQLEAAHNDIENLLNTADLAVVFLDVSMCIRRFNPAFTRYVELNMSDTGRPISIFASNFVQSAFTKLLNLIKDIRSDSEEVLCELPLQDGSWALARIRPFTGKDPEQFSGSAITIQDVTSQYRMQNEIRHQRDRLEGLLEAESAGYWDWDLENNTEYYSPRFKAMLGYQGDELPNSPETWQRLIHPDDLPVALSNFEKHVKTNGKHPYDQEARYYHKDGSIVWVICRGRVVEWSKDGQPKRMIGVHLDITAQKNREMAFQEEARRWVLFNQNATSHLVDPMSSLLQGLGVLEEQIEIPEGSNSGQLLVTLKAVASTLRDRISHLEHYVTNFARESKAELLNMAEVLDDSLIDLQPKIKENDVRLIIEDLPNCIGVRNLFVILFQNLINLSLGSIEEGKRCRITISGSVEPDGTTVFLLNDNGKGVAQDDVEKAFEIHYEPHDTRSYIGEGVALPVCRRIVEHHGGTIQLWNNPEGGTRVQIRLPKVQRQDVPLPN